MAIWEFLAERLADYEIPRKFALLKEFSKTESGKFVKKNCENCFFLSKKENDLLCKMTKVTLTKLEKSGIFTYSNQTI